MKELVHLLHSTVPNAQIRILIICDFTLGDFPGDPGQLPGEGRNELPHTPGLLSIAPAVLA